MSTPHTLPAPVAAKPLPRPARRRRRIPLIGFAVAALLLGGVAAPTPAGAAADEGKVYAFGGAPFHGHAGDGLAQPVVGLAAHPGGDGYWLVATDGGVFSFGAAAFHGSTGATPLNQPIVDIAATPSGNGYWFVARDGGIFAFGDAVFHGSTGDTALNSPIVGMAPTRTGGGYVLVAADGGIFTFGDARFAGSLGDERLASPVVGIALTPSGNGYWLVAADGGVFTFGDAAFHGSPAGPGHTVTGIDRTPSGQGYWVTAEDGRVWAYGDAAFHGAAADYAPDAPVADIAARPQGGYWQATARPAPPPPPPSGYRASGEPSDADFDRLAGCESGGNWAANSGNGYYGGLQFSLSSWQAVGGPGYPHEHPRETQIEMGRRLWRAQGWSAWPHCSRQLGYR